jgi:hypothetical protein
LGDDIQSQLIHCPLMFAAAVGVVRIIQAGESDGHRLASFYFDLGFVEAAHVGSNIDHVASHRWRCRAEESRIEIITGEPEYSNNDDCKYDRADAPLALISLPTG